MKTRQQEQVSDFPYGWNKGDTCVMITNKAKKSTCEYTVENYDGRYFGVRSHTGLFYRASHMLFNCFSLFLRKEI